MKAVYRLRENRDFRRTFQRGKSAATSRLVLYWNESRQSGFRVGFSVSKKVGNAVVRNRVKRRLRACFDSYQPDLASRHVDFVVICRPSAAAASFAELDQDLRRLLHRAHFVVS